MLEKQLRLLLKTTLKATSIYWLDDLLKGRVTDSAKIKQREVFNIFDFHNIILPQTLKPHEDVIDSYCFKT
jgi:hypothetical protein